MFVLLGLACIFLLGVWLRLHSLFSQILLDDEWHALNDVIGKSYSGAFTHFNPADNSSLPFKLYDLFLYHTVGWSELLLRLPVIAAGLLCVIIWPLLIRRLFRDRVVLLFAGLTAIAPFLVFYSRYSRSYGVMVLFCFWALLSSHQWLTTGRRRCGVVFVLAGAAAIYAHLAAAVAVAVPILLGCALRPAERIAVSLKELLTAAAALIILILPGLIPVMTQGSNLPWERGALTLRGMLNAATLMSGTGSIPLNIFFYVLCVSGTAILLRERPVLGWIYALVACAYALALAIASPAGVQNGAVVARYTIVLLPMAYSAVALALDRAAGFAEARLGGAKAAAWGALPSVAAALIVLCFFAAGPLAAMPRGDFENHAAFQASYSPRDWEDSEANTVYPALVLKREAVPAFYGWLREQPDIHTVIEYPLDVCDYNDLFWYYQHFHGKRVLAGYFGDPALLGYSVQHREDLGDATGIGMLSADQILSRVADRSKLRFRNMVDVTRPAFTRGADVIILHKTIDALKFAPSGPGRIRVIYGAVEALKERIGQIAGPPIYEDPEMVCYRIGPARS